ncbi:MAG TPA: thrombospondin type 3 repeat-containing protein [Acidobacteriota bacterium]|nr:thrombospondin type 3 repeat-containing protein [Acidobacteriota bacterium]
MTRISVCLAVVALLSLPAVATSQNLLNGPESVACDTLRDCYLVSNWRDGKIVRIDREGNQSYFNTSQTAVAGIHIRDDVLYCASTPVGLVGFDLETGSVVFGPIAAGPHLPQDVTSDTSGYVYVTQTTDGVVYRVDVATQTCTTFVTAGFDGAGGIMFDAQANRLLVAFASDGVGDLIYSVSLPEGVLSLVISTEVPAIDGLTEDDEGNIYLSSYTTGKVYKTTHDLVGPYELWSSGYLAGADIEYDRKRGILAVPEFLADRLTLVLDPVADPDDDGVLHATDNCPWTSNPGQDDTDSDGIGDACDNCPETPNPSQADLNHSGIGDVCEPGFTRPGGWVSVDLTDSIRIMFAEVTEAGVTVVTLSGSGPAAPSGYRPVSAAGLPYYDIHTDATYTGTILVRFLYDPAWLLGPEEDLLLFHEIEGGGWEDCTYSQDVGSHVIWAETDGLSNFILAEPGCPCDCHGDPQCDGVTNVLDVVRAVNVSFRSETAATDPGCPNEQTDVSCDGVTNVIDVVKFVNVAFRSGDPLLQFCDPCAP